MKLATNAFPLARFFVVTSFATTIIVALITAIVTSRSVRFDLLEEAKANAIQVTRHLQKDIQTFFILPLIASDGEIDLENNQKHYEALDKVVRRVATSFDMRDIYIFDDNGFIIYSTNWEHRGMRTPDNNTLYWDAIEGKEVSSAILGRGAPLDLSTTASTSLLETYVPVRSLADPDADRIEGAVQNVIETYQDITKLQEEVVSAQTWSALYAVLSTSTLFLVLLGLVIHADRLIGRQTSELVESNENLRILSQHLEAEVERRTLQLIQREKLASLGTLAAGLAHEVNNPLATISSCAEGLSQRMKESSNYGDLDEKDFKSYLQLIQNEAFRVKEITENLLDFSRQRPATEREVTDLQQLLSETIELLRVSRKIDDVDIRVKTVDTDGRFEVNASETRQLFFNVTRNAADSIRELIDNKKVDELQRSKKGEIVWTITASEDWIELSCTDNGIGFEPGTELELLEPFYTTKPPGQGTGLGLALCHSIVERHGGHLTISSKGKLGGATVTISLPKAETKGDTR